MQPQYGRTLIDQSLAVQVAFLERSNEPNNRFGGRRDASKVQGCVNEFAATVNAASYRLLSNRQVNDNDQQEETEHNLHCHKFANLGAVWKYVAITDRRLSY